jgi:cytochrome P450
MCVCSTDSASGVTVDLVSEFSKEVPMRVVAGVLGLPQDAAPHLRRWADIIECVAVANGREGPAHSLHHPRTPFTPQRRAYVVPQSLPASDAPVQNA